MDKELTDVDLLCCLVLNYVQSFWDQLILYLKNCLYCIDRSNSARMQGFYYMSISIIIPVHNVSAYIERCLLSVINQTYLDIECIIVDDAFVEDALSYSRDKIFLIEEFIVKNGPQISGDAFSVNGKLVFHCLGNEFYSKKVDKDFAPLGECWPTVMPQEVIDTLVGDLQRLITLLGMRSNAYNVEAIYGEDGKVYILELGARSGGSLIPQVIALATGVDMVPYVIKAALGEDCSDLKMAPVKGFWSNYMAHASETGKYAGIEYAEAFRKNNLVDFVTDIKIGDPVHKYRDAQDCVGELILKYDSMEQMENIIKKMNCYAQI